MYFEKSQEALRLATKSLVAENSKGEVQEKRNFLIQACVNSYHRTRLASTSHGNYRRHPAAEDKAVSN